MGSEQCRGGERKGGRCKELDGVGIGERSQGRLLSERKERTEIWGPVPRGSSSIDCDRELREAPAC